MHLKTRFLGMIGAILVGLSANIGHAADITLMERNPVLFGGYLEGASATKTRGIGIESLRNGCLHEGCSDALTQDDLLRRKKRDIESSLWQFDDGLALDGSLTYAESHNGAVMTSLGYSKVVLISGQLQAGDAEKLAEFVQANDVMDCLEPGYCPFNSVIALDSPGGSLVEALKIAEYVQKHNFVTLLPANARCESACAMIYLSGYTTYEGFFHPRRAAHDTAKLGLHTPYLALPPREYSKEEVDKVQQIINTSLNNVVELFASARVDLNVLKEMYLTPHDQMYYASVPELESLGTVFHSGLAGADLTRSQALSLCAEDYKVRYGTYEPQLLQRLASADDVFITYVPKRDYACYGKREGNSWRYETCTPSGSRYDVLSRLPCNLYECATRFEDGEHCRAWGDQQYIDVFNQDNLGDALAAMRNSKLLQLTRQALSGDIGSVVCTEDGCANGEIPNVPSWVQRAKVPDAYCGEVDMRSPTNLQLLQRALNDNGINVGTPDGSIGPKTLGAIGTANKRFLGKNSQWAEPALLQALGLDMAEVQSTMFCD